MAKYLTWNSKRSTFVKKTSMLNPVKSLGYIKCSSSTNLLKALAILLNATDRKSAVDWEHLKPSKNHQNHQKKKKKKKNSKKEHISVGDQQAYYLDVFFEDFTNDRKKTDRVVD